VKVRFAKIFKLNQLISNIRKETEVCKAAFNMSIREIILADRTEADRNLELIAEKENCNLIISVFRDKVIFKKI
jgi:hypothetical protein